MAILTQKIDKITKPEWLKQESDDCWVLNKLRPVTVILGKNGSGKSKLLESIAEKRLIIGEVIDAENNKTICSQLRIFKTSAERGGVSKLQGNVLDSVVNDASFVQNVNFKNENRQFRQVATANYHQMLTAVTHASLQDTKSQSPTQIAAEIVGKLSDLMPEKYRVVPSANQASLVVVDSNNKEVPFDQLSSGEKEVFSLALDCLVKAYSPNPLGQGVLLLLDEPDVHIHPDLQIKFINFLIDLASNLPIQVLIATHSLVFLSGVHDGENLGYIFLEDGGSIYSAANQSKRLDEAATLIGNSLVGHVITNNKLLLVEGPDEVDVWNQAMRSSDGKLGLYAKACGGKPGVLQVEKRLNLIAKALIDGSRIVAVSLIDRDDTEPSSFDKNLYPNISRHLTGCYEIENLVLSDEVLDRFKKKRENVYEGDPLNDDLKDRVHKGDLWSIISEDIGVTWQSSVGQKIGQEIKKYLEKPGEYFLNKKETSVLCMLGQPLIVSLFGDVLNDDE